MDESASQRQRGEVSFVCGIENGGAVGQSYTLCCSLLLAPRSAWLACSDANQGWLTYKLGLVQAVQSIGRPTGEADKASIALLIVPREGGS
jgi:hypothetical protein